MTTKLYCGHITGDKPGPMPHMNGEGCYCEGCRAWVRAMPVDDVDRLREENKRLREALRELLDVLEDEYGTGCCDCRPEPENFGHTCPQCRARLLLQEVTK